MSRELCAKLQVALGELAIVYRQFEALSVVPASANVGVIETSAACAMLHSFYTEVEKILKLIAREWDDHLPASESWHRDLLLQMAEATPKRPAVISEALLPTLKEYLAFRHLFRGASIALMRWEKLHPLVAKAEATYEQAKREVEAFVRFVERDAGEG